MKLPSASDDLPQWLRAALEMDSPKECEQAVLRQVRQLRKVLHPDRPSMKRGPRPPDVYGPTVAVLAPLWDGLNQFGGLLCLKPMELKKLKPGVVVTTPEGEITVTPQILQAVKSWRGLRFIEHVVVAVQQRLGDNPARAKKLSKLQDRRERLQSQVKKTTINYAHQRELREVLGQIKAIEDESFHYHESTLRKPVREAAIRFLLSVGVCWHEMPSSLIDKRQPWLRKGNRISTYNERQSALLRYQGSDNAQEFEARNDAFLASLENQHKKT